MTVPTAAPPNPTETGDASDFYQNLLDEVNDGVYFVDPGRRITYWSKGAERITGYAADEVVNHRCADEVLVHVDDVGTCLCREGCPLLETMKDGKRRSMNVFLRHKAGHRVPVLVRTAPIFSEYGHLIGAVETFRDDSQTIANQDHIRKLAKLVLLDSLTGIGNRRYLEGVIGSHLSTYKKCGIPMAVCIVDIDRFKRLNDTMGHGVGDKAISLVAKTLVSSVGTGGTVGRWGGDELLVVASHLDGEQAEALASKLLALVRSSSLIVDGQRIGVTVSIGVATACPRDDATSLVKRADCGLYKSKSNGRDRVTFEPA